MAQIRFSYKNGETEIFDITRKNLVVIRPQDQAIYIGDDVHMNFHNVEEIEIFEEGGGIEELIPQEEYESQNDYGEHIPQKISKDQTTL